MEFISVPIFGCFLGVLLIPVFVVLRLIWHAGTYFANKK